MKLCFDVTDNNFCDLFSESPEEVTDRCSRLRGQVAESDTLIYYNGDEAADALTISCAGREWVAYSGFGETFDYILPSGEVACLPESVDGNTASRRRIVGTIPFGVKSVGYAGRVRPATQESKS